MPTEAADELQDRSPWMTQHSVLAVEKHVIVTQHACEQAPDGTASTSSRRKVHCVFVALDRSLRFALCLPSASEAGQPKEVVEVICWRASLIVSHRVRGPLRWSTRAVVNDMCGTGLSSRELLFRQLSACLAVAPPPAIFVCMFQLFCSGWGSC